MKAFLEAARTGCHWLEMDVVITGDNEVLVSHEPWMDPATCTGPAGMPLSEEAGRSANIFKMSVEEVQRYHLLPAGAFATWKPTLTEVHAHVHRECAENSMPMPRFNIEVKSDPAWYGTYQPSPAVFAQRMVQEIHVVGLHGHCLVQSFDPAILEVMHRTDPSIPLALLVENRASMAENLHLLDFTPAYYSPEHHQIDVAVVAEVRSRGMGLLTWTVNEAADMRRMIALGVDGLITDRPELAMRLLRDHGARTVG
ncbi:MAG: hypothetical protein IT230_00235 [Flavobacteriales bacterium]|nr:hypothetical protein [Flavobacteriales bacterium]